MDPVFIIPIIATILFVIAKYLDSRFIEKQSKPLKIVVRDTLVVFVCVLLANLAAVGINGSISDLFSVITSKKTIAGSAVPEAFTDKPNF